MFVRLNLILLVAVLASSPSLNFAAAQFVAPTQTEFGHITALETGHIGFTMFTFQGVAFPFWTREPADTMSVSLDVPFVNATEPGPKGINCESTNSGYALDPKDPGVKVHEAALMSAFLAGKKVRLHLEGCIYSKPRIYSVEIH